MATFSIEGQALVVMRETFVVEAEDEETARELVLQGDVEPEDRWATDEHSHEIVHVQKLKSKDDVEVGETLSTQHRKFIKQSEVANVK